MRKNYKEKVKMYSALAGGIILAANQEADAQVVYTDIADAVISGSNNSGTNTYDLDMNNDGVSDFRLIRSTYYSTYFKINGLSLSGNRAQNSSVYPTWSVGKLNFNDAISYNYNFSDSYLGGTNGSSTYGAWANGATDKYIGVRFYVNSVVYYGWIRIDVASDFSTLTIKDFAYESNSNTVIKAGAKSSAGAAISVYGFDNGNTGTASDIHFFFTKAYNEASLSTYRAFIVPATQTFTLDNAQNTYSGYSFDVAKGPVYFNVACPTALPDVNGNTIVPGTPYNVYVMSVGATGYDDFLAKSNSTVTFSTVTAVDDASDVTANVVYYNNTLVLNNMPTEGTVEVFTMTGAKIFDGSVSPGDNKYNVTGSSTGICIAKVSLTDRVVTKRIFIEQK